MADAPVVRVTELEVRFRRFKLGPLSFALRPGEVACVVGLNASGKTTLLRTLAGRREVYGGSTVVLGTEARHDSAAVRASVGFLPDRLPAIPTLRVREYHDFMSRFHPTWDREYARTLCGKLGIDPDAPMGTLSKGTRIKVGLVAAEAFRPPLLILDEPTSGLDLRARQTFLEVVTRALADAPERALIFSTHVVDDAHRLTSRVLALENGSLHAEIQPTQIDAFIESGTTETIATRTNGHGR